MATMDKLKVSVVILNYNGLKNTLECVESIKKQDYSKNLLEIIVIDNNSEDGSQEALPKIKGINFIQNYSNLGYAGGNNIGIKKALVRKANFILILNNDTVAEKSLISNLIESSKNGDIVSPKIYFAKGYEFHKKYKENQLGKVIWSAGAKIDWNNILGIHIGVDEVDTGQFAKSKRIDFATGAAMLIKKEVFEKIGLFNEKYFLYLEDMDFCVRAQRSKFKIIYSPKSILWHKNAGSSGGSGSKLQDYFISRNRLLFAFKYAKLKTKFAVFRQILSQISNETKRKAFFDFLLFKFGKGNYIK